MLCIIVIYNTLKNLITIDIITVINNNLEYYSILSFQLKNLKIKKWNDYNITCH
jgi:hypothetical protein